MAVATPEWLAKRDCRLLLNPNGNTWSVLIEGEPQYLIMPFPAAGKYGCRVIQAINSKHLESNNVYPTEEDAARGGLEDLRKALGW